MISQNILGISSHTHTLSFQEILLAFQGMQSTDSLVGGQSSHLAQESSFRDKVCKVRLTPHSTAITRHLNHEPGIINCLTTLQWLPKTLVKPKSILWSLRYPTISHPSSPTLLSLSLLWPQHAGHTPPKGTGTCSLFYL